MIGPKFSFEIDTKENVIDKIGYILVEVTLETLLW